MLFEDFSVIFGDLFHITFFTSFLKTKANFSEGKWIQTFDTIETFKAFFYPWAQLLADTYPKFLAP